MLVLSNSHSTLPPFAGLWKHFKPGSEIIRSSFLFFSSLFLLCCPPVVHHDLFGPIKDWAACCFTSVCSVRMRWPTKNSSLAWILLVLSAAPTWVYGCKSDTHFFGKLQCSVNRIVRKRLTVGYNEIKHPLKIEPFFTTSCQFPPFPPACHFILSHLYCSGLQISRNP